MPLLRSHWQCTGFSEQQLAFIETLQACKIDENTYTVTIADTRVTIGRTMENHPPAYDGEIFVTSMDGKDIKQAIEILSSKAAKHGLDILIRVENSQEDIHIWLQRKEIHPWNGPFLSPHYTVPAGSLSEPSR